MRAGVVLGLVLLWAGGALAVSCGAPEDADCGMNAANPCADDAKRIVGAGGHEGTGGTGSLGGTGGVATVCSSAAECDETDGEPCTVPSCTLDGHCVEVANGSATPTDDGNPCTDDACVNGVSTYTFNTADCGEGPSCTNAAAKAQDKCDGAGNCQPGNSTNCLPYACDANQPQCKTKCSNDMDCTDAYCQGLVCKPKLDNGKVCLSPQVCLSGQCADDVCCNFECDGPCVSCNLGGAAPGTCSSLPKGVVDTCAAGSACSGSGTCATLGNKKAVGQPCSVAGECFNYAGAGDPAGCINGLCRLAVGAACDVNKPHECETNLCDATTRQCKECLADAECPGNVKKCDMNSHHCYLGAGAVCGSAADCSPGHDCTNNVCQ